MFKRKVNVNLRVHSRNEGVSIEMKDYSDLGTAGGSFLLGQIMLIIMHLGFYFKRYFLQFLSPSSFEILFHSFEGLISYFLIFYFDTEIPCKEAEPCN